MPHYGPSADEHSQFNTIASISFFCSLSSADDLFRGSTDFMSPASEVQIEVTHNDFSQWRAKRPSVRSMVVEVDVAGLMELILGIDLPAEPTVFSTGRILRFSPFDDDVLYLKNTSAHKTLGSTIW